MENERDIEMHLSDYDMGIIDSKTKQFITKKTFEMNLSTETQLYLDENYYHDLKCASLQSDSLDLLYI